MALPDGFTNFHCVGLGLLFIGNVLHIVGLATPGWTTGYLGIQSNSKAVSFGLWKACLQECVDITQFNYPGSYLDAWKAAEAFAILGMISGLAALAAGMVYFLSRLLNKKTLDFLQLVTLAAGILSLVLIIISIACYGGGVHNKLGDFPGKSFGYSLILSIIGGILIMIAGVAFFFPSRSNV